jgi:DNA-binding HxlR family transcriptional regulator
VREIGFGNTRFSQIVRNTGAPRDRIAARLRALVDAGVLTKTDGAGYQLTEAGRDLGRTTTALLEWGDRWAVTEPPMRLRHHDHPMPRTSVVCDTCGERVHRGDVTRESLLDDWTLDGPAPVR